MNIVSKFTAERNIQYQSDEGFRNNINFVLTFLSVLIFGIFAIRPAINTITGLVKDIEEYRKVNGVLTEKIQILNEVKADPERLEKETDLISRALPTNPDEGSYLRNVNFLATNNQLQIESITFDVIDEGGLGALGFNLTIQGEYKRIIQFIADFNKLLRITNVEDISISPQKENQRVVKAVISGRAYFLLETND